MLKFVHLEQVLVLVLLKLRLLDLLLGCSIMTTRRTDRRILTLVSRLLGGSQQIFLFKDRAQHGFRRVRLDVLVGLHLIKHLDPAARGGRQHLFDCLRHQTSGDGTLGRHPGDI